MSDYVSLRISLMIFFLSRTAGLATPTGSRDKVEVQVTDADKERYGLNSLVVPASMGKVTVTPDDIARLGLNTPVAPHPVHGIVVTPEVSFSQTLNPKP